MVEPYARIARWAILRLQAPHPAPTIHIVGYIDEHTRLLDKVGEPYLSSNLRMVDIERGVAVNCRKRFIALVGDPLPRGDLPDDIRAITRGAAERWGLSGGATWERLELFARRKRRTQAVQAGKSGRRPKTPAQASQSGSPPASLECWHLIRAAGRWHIVGFVSGRCRSSNGRLVVTSKVVDIHPLPTGQVKLETLNASYVLGKPWSGELSKECYELLDAVLPKEWQAVTLDDLTQRMGRS